MLKQLSAEIGHDHPNIIILAFEIVTSFGEVLEKNGWMIYGAPVSLLPDTKENVQYAFELLHRFLNNQKGWSNFRNRYPEKANLIISNNFYKALMNAIPLTERFIDDDDVKACVELAEYLKNKKSNKARSFLRNKEKSAKVFKVQKQIDNNIKKLFNYIDSQGLFIKDNIFD